MISAASRTKILQASQKRKLLTNKLLTVRMQGKKKSTHLSILSRQSGDFPPSCPAYIAEGKFSPKT